MASDLILTTAQAQAVYSAMCALNAVGGKLETTVDDVLVRVGVLTGRVSVVSAFDADDRRETYDDQDAFAAAYGLPCGMAFTVSHVDHGAIVVDHVQASSADAALEQALQQGLTDPVVFAGHIKAQASA